MPDEKNTPEQEAADKAMRDAGYAPGLQMDDGTGIPLESESDERTGEAKTPQEESPAEPPKPKWTDEEVERWKDRAGWAEREKERADRERQERETLAAEVTRLRNVLGAPQQPAQKPVKELTEDQRRAREWFIEQLSDPDVVSAIPAEALSKHPAFTARDVAIFHTRDQLEQTQFLSGFPREQRQVIRQRLLPSLSASRRSVGFQKTYDELWQEHRQAARESAQLYGLSLQEEKPGAPAAPVLKASPTEIPPTLSGVRGGGAAPSGAAPQTAPLTEEDLRLMGFK